MFFVLLVNSLLLRQQSIQYNLGNMSFSDHLNISLKENMAKLGVGSKDDIENWFSGEKLGVSG